MSTSPKVIGVSGAHASGQDTLAGHLAQTLGYVQFSTSDAVREVAQARYGSIERPILRKTGLEIRTEKGAGALVEVALQHLEKSGLPGLVVSGIRTMGEMQAVLDAGGVMLYTDADPELRYKRMQARARDAEMHLSHEEFMEHEAREWHAGDSDADFNKRDIRAHAEKEGTIIFNESDLASFLSQADKVVRELL
jgi:dephospho-CoA kinase